MCGLAGIVGRLDDRHRDALSRMSGAMVHRGPDGAGEWTSVPDDRGWGCMLAFRRLSILDLSTAADQPMTDPAGGMTIVFNGEIYNYAELRDGLCARGESFSSSGDTAVMLRLLATDGVQACSQLRGMFAFAVWDAAQRRLTVGRDPHGIKPLYVCRNHDPDGAWSLIFASELRALLASGLLGRPRLNRGAVASMVWNGFVMGPQTIVDGVELLPAGVVRTYHGDGRQAESRTFWSMPATGLEGDPSDTELHEALAESVRLHLASDVPLGVFLSGGVDSSAVANLAQRARCGDRIASFTLTFEDPTYDEGRWASAVAQAIGTEHHEIVLTESAFVRDLDAAIATLDQPTFDGLNSFYMSKAVREAGITVALVGTGGDELFGGYQTFRHLPRLARWSRSAALPMSVKLALARAVAGWRQRSRSGGVPPQSRWSKLPAMVEANGDLLALYQLSYALFLPELQAQLLADGEAGTSQGLPTELHRQLDTEVAGRSALAALSVLEQRCFLGERLLRDSDAASMAVSLELRLPLVDQVLTTEVGSMPDTARFDPVGRKQALRDAGLVGLDPALFERPKQGFQLPFDRWIRQNLGAAMDDTMSDQRACAAVGLDGAVVGQIWSAFRDGAPGVYWSRVWALYVLVRWCHTHGVLV